MDISKNIKTIRETKGLKQSDIAKILEMERTNYHRLESRGEKLTIEQLQSIAGALGVSAVELLGGEAKIETNSEELESLKQRVFELEDRIIDKTTLIRRYLDDFESLSSDIEHWFCESYFHQIAIKKNIGKVNILENGKVIETVDIAVFYNYTDEYWKDDEYPMMFKGELIYYKSPRVEYEHYFERNDKVKIVSMIYDTDFLGVNITYILGRICNEFGKIESEVYNISIDPSVFEEAYNNYSTKR